MSKDVNKLKDKFSGEKGKKNVKKAAAVALAASLAAGAAAMPDNQEDFSKIQMPTAVVQTIDSMNAEYNPDTVDEEKQQVKTSAGETVAKVIAAPLYAIGAVIMRVFELFASGVIAPVLLIILKWVILAAAIIGALAICFKVAFPDIPLGKLLNKKCIGFILGGVTLGSIVCEVLPIFWEDADPWIFAIHVAFGLAVFLPVLITVMKVAGSKKHGKQKQAV